MTIHPIAEVAPRTWLASDRRYYVCDEDFTDEDGYSIWCSFPSRSALNQWLWFVQHAPQDGPAEIGLNAREAFFKALGGRLETHPFDLVPSP